MDNLKGASEYIQASSRVGREQDKPGLVIANYNPFKPRDRSHFETFRSYHENAYRYVEPTSVTPFSLPVCERAIHALAITLIRYRYACDAPHARERDQQGDDQGKSPRSSGDALRRYLPDEENRAMQTLKTFFDGWNQSPPNHYGELQRASDRRAHDVASRQGTSSQSPNDERRQADSLIHAERGRGLRGDGDSTIPGRSDAMKATRAARLDFGGRKASKKTTPTKVL